jgi:hypothetical protein
MNDTKIPHSVIPRPLSLHAEDESIVTFLERHKQAIG